MAAFWGCSALSSEDAGVAVSSSQEIGHQMEFLVMDSDIGYMHSRPILLLVLGLWFLQGLCYDHSFDVASEKNKAHN